MIEEWVIRNLHRYNNSVIPNTLIKKEGIDTINKVLTKQIGKKVKIRLSYLNKSTNITSKKKSKADEIYIAEII